MKRSFLKYLALSSLYKQVHDVHLLNRSNWNKQVLRQGHDSVSVCSSKTGPSTREEADEQKATQTQSYMNKSKLFSFLQLVKPDKLSAGELVIHTRHVEALERGDDTYKDPLTGNVVFTRLAHLKRGHCCGSTCRHCPYGQTAVPQDRPKKSYNSAFYV